MNRVALAEKLGGKPQGGREAVVIETRDPDQWRKAFAAAAGGRGPVFLANPDWGRTERAALADQIRKLPADEDPETGWLMIPTGGSTGGVRFARHDQTTLQAAVDGYTTFFHEPVVSALGILPLHHVSGLMGWLRTALTGGEFVAGDWARIAAGSWPSVTGQGRTISLVPTQLRRLLVADEGSAWLRQFGRVLVGGAALDRGLGESARQADIALVPSYGSTETAAMVAAQPAGSAAPGFVALPHATIDQDAAGQLRVAGPSLFRGYWPHRRSVPGPWESGDLAEALPGGRFVVLGRMDALIITGGEKVSPAEVEPVLRDLFGDERIAVIGVPDAHWGQRLVMVHAPELAVDLGRMKTAGLQRLADFKWPKAAVVCDPWPVNEVGKLDRTRLQAAVAAAAKI